MANTSKASPKRAKTTPQWQTVAERLEALASQPTKPQLALAKKLGVELGDNLPAPVAAVLLRYALRDQLILKFYDDDDRYEDALEELRSELDLDDDVTDDTGTTAEKRAWLDAYYMLRSARGLRALQADPGDLVTCDGWNPQGDVREISTISPNGRVNMKGRPPRRAWPNYLQVIARQGDPNFKGHLKDSRNKLANNGYRSTNNLDRFEPLKDYRVDSQGPSSEAIRMLESLLESGKTEEVFYQELIEQYPSLLASLVVGSYATYVIPHPNLGGAHIPDFFVLGINSLGPQWVMVEIEATKHKMHHANDGHLMNEVKHAVEQIDDWRNWLTTNAATAQNDYHFHGLNNQAQGLVIIGRGDVQSLRDNARSISAEQKRIDIHSWDWLLREARSRTGNGTYRTLFDSDPDSPYAPGPPRGFIPGEDDLLDVLNDFEFFDIDAEESSVS